MNMKVICNLTKIRTKHHTCGHPHRESWVNAQRDSANLIRDLLSVIARCDNTKLPAKYRQAGSHCTSKPWIYNKVTWTSVANQDAKKGQSLSCPGCVAKGNWEQFHVGWPLVLLSRFLFLVPVADWNKICLVWKYKHWWILETTTVFFHEQIACSTFVNLEWYVFLFILCQYSTTQANCTSNASTEQYNRIHSSFCH